MNIKIRLVQNTVKSLALLNGRLVQLPVTVAGLGALPGGGGGREFFPPRFGSRYRKK